MRRLVPYIIFLFAFSAILVPSSQAANEAEIRDRIKTVVASINESLDSGLARYGLLKFVESWHTARVGLVTVGYENKTEFVDGIYKILPVLKMALQAKELKTTVEAAFINEMVDAYLKNESVFYYFVKVSRENNYDFALMDDDEILNTQIRYASILYNYRMDTWHFARKWSFILPFSEGF